MLERITNQEQIQELYKALSSEYTWYWWIEGANPSYAKFESWLLGCDQDPIGFFINRYRKQAGEYKLFGFSTFSRTDLVHGFTYITVWISPELRKVRSILPYGAITALESINFAFQNFPIRKIYQNIIEGNVQARLPIQRVCSIEGVLKKHYFVDGEYRDVSTYSIAREEWNIFYNKYVPRFAKYLS